MVIGNYYYFLLIVKNRFLNVILHLVRFLTYLTLFVKRNAFNSLRQILKVTSSIYFLDVPWLKEALSYLNS